MKKIKGFTLVELIIVMAIMVILMAALMNMMKPIRSTYIDSTLYESQRNTQSGINQYLTESLRYATNLGIYTAGQSGVFTYDASTDINRSVTDVTDAVDYFLDDVSGMTTANLMPTGTDKTNAQAGAQLIRDELEKQVQVIIIDNKTNFVYNNKNLRGRMLRKKGVDVVSADYEDPTTDECRMALGDSYYGENSFYVDIDIKEETTTTALMFTVSSVTDTNLMPGTFVSSEAEAICRNLNVSSSTSNLLGTKLGVSADVLSSLKLTKPFFDYSLYDGNPVTDKYDGLSGSMDAKTYIVFLLPE